VAAKREQLIAGADIPNPQGMILAGGDDASGVGKKRDIEHARRVPEGDGEFRHILTIGVGRARIIATSG